MIELRLSDVLAPKLADALVAAAELALYVEHVDVPPAVADLALALRLKLADLQIDVERRTTLDTITRTMQGSPP